jgi:hypothetical protein
MASIAYRGDAAGLVDIVDFGSHGCEQLTLYLRESRREIGPSCRADHHTRAESCHSMHSFRREAHPLLLQSLGGVKMAGKDLYTSRHEAVQLSPQ